MPAREIPGTVCERIMGKIEFDTNGGCWLWAGRTTRFGYGQMWTEGREQRAHRVSYAAFVGPIPSGLYVCHKCDISSCVNPAHLYAGTHAENMADRTAKGRTARLPGSASPWAKLTEESALDVVRRSRAGERHTAIAADVGISPLTVWKIATGRSWKHLDRSAL